MMTQPWKGTMGRYGLIFALAAILTASAARAAERVDWFVQDAPPLYIQSGPYAGKGIDDQWIALFSKRLRQFDHHVVDSSFARAWHDIDKRDGLCLAGVQKTPEREQLALFSRPLMVTPPIQLVALRERSELFGALTGPDGQILLDRLAARPELVAGYATKRALDPAIEEFLNARKESGKIEAMPSQAALFALLMAHRIDFLFASEGERRYFGLTNNVADRLAGYDVTGVQPGVPIHVACSRGPVGAAVIGQIDRLAGQPGFLDHLYDLGRTWRSEPR